MVVQNIKIEIQKKLKKFVGDNNDSENTDEEYNSRIPIKKKNRFLIPKNNELNIDDYYSNQTNDITFDHKNDSNNKTFNLTNNTNNQTDLKIYKLQTTNQIERLVREKKILMTDIKDLKLEIYSLKTALNEQKVCNCIFYLFLSV